MSDQIKPDLASLLERLKAEIDGWDDAAELIYKKSCKASTQEKASYHEGRAAGYEACGTALLRIIKEFERG